MPRPYQHYPWDEWFAKKKFTIHRGVDYQVNRAAMCQQIRTWALKKHVHVRIDAREDSITVEVVRVLPQLPLTVG